MFKFLRFQMRHLRQMWRCHLAVSRVRHPPGGSLRHGSLPIGKSWHPDDSPTNQWDGNLATLHSSVERATLTRLSFSLRLLFVKRLVPEASGFDDLHFIKRKPTVVWAKQNEIFGLSVEFYPGTISFLNGSRST
jgi:hypothetical protein